MTSGDGRVLFVFLDGVGLAAPEAPDNPFHTTGTPALRSLLGASLDADLPVRTGTDLTVRQLDATLGVPGLPQSATGQTALLTGRNAALYMGGHYGPWPGPTLRTLLSEGNLFSEVRNAGLPAAIANLYPPGYFRALERNRLRVNTPVHSALEAGVPLRTVTEFERAEAVSADLTGNYVRSIVPLSRSVDAATSARDLRRIATGSAFTFFDFWLSDQVGHRGSFEDAENLVRDLDVFLAAVLEPAADGVTVLVTSDHGNLEDKSVRTHTRNMVPLLASGPGAARFADVNDLTGIAPAVRSILGL